MNYRKQQLMELIRSYPNGCRLSIQEISERLGVSKVTVCKTLKLLDQEGKITRSNYFENKKRVYIIKEK